MGRRQVIGDEVCPKCKNIGRSYVTKTRSRSSAMYVKRCYFLHNDRSIAKHYIDNFNKKEKKPPTMQDVIEEYRHFLYREGEIVKILPLTKQENKNGISEVFRLSDFFEASLEMLAIHLIKAEYDSQNKPLPKKLKSMWNRVRRAEKQGEEAQRRFDKMRIENPSKAANYFEKLLKSIPMVTHWWKIHDKYILPQKLERNKRRNQKLRDTYNYPPWTLPELDQP